MENNPELPPKVKRLDNLHKTDSPEEDSVWDLAHKEKEFREKLKEAEMPKENIDEIADEISDETLEKIEAEKEAMLDPLTGLVRRPTLEKYVSMIMKVRKKTSFGEEKRVIEKRKPCHSLILLDIDRFKNINDSYGHSAGDKVLSEVSKAIAGTLRQRELSCRWGGEEIAIFIPDVDSSATTKIAERIRETIEKLKVKIDDKREISVTVSLGYSDTDQISLEANGKSILEAMVENSDAAMYRAKDEGRNKSVAFDEGMKK